MTTNYNFRDEAIAKYDAVTYERFIDFFNVLPLMATVSNAQGRFACVHGGLSPNIVKVEDVLEIDRFGEVPKGGPMCDLLWSDPLADWTADDLDEDIM